jgi:hypothetical protein
MSIAKTSVNSTPQSLYRLRIKRITFNIPESELYIYHALLKSAYETDMTISKLSLLAIKEYLLRQISQEKAETR